MYKFKAFNIFNRITKSNHAQSITKIHHSNVNDKFIEQNLSAESKIYQASQAIYAENIEPDVKYLAKSLIYIDDCRAYRLTGNKKLKKIAYDNAINCYIKGVNNYLESLTKINNKNLDNSTQTKNAWKDAGKYSYLKGRGATAGGHISTVLHNLAYCTFSAVKDASLSSAFSFMGPIATLIGTVLYRPLGDAIMGLVRPYTKANEEVYSKFGFPRLNNKLEKSDNISEAIKKFNDTKIDSTLVLINQLSDKALFINKNLKNLNLQQIYNFKKELAYEYNNISKCNHNIQQLRAARGRERIEFEHNLSTLKINSVVTAGNIIASSIGSASVAFAPPFSPFIKLGAAATTFSLTLAQYFLNSYFSGKNLVKKFEQTIYENIKSDLGSYYNEGKDINNIKKLKQQYEHKLQYASTNYEIKILTNIYENELKKVINLKNMTNWWQKPTQRSSKIANEWLDAQIQEKLYKFLEIRINYMHSKKLITKNDANKLENIAKELEDLLYDKEIISNLINKILLQQNNYNSGHNSNTSTYEFSRLLKLTRNSEVVDIFVDSKVASKCMTYIKASDHNNKLRDFASYFGPGLFTSFFTSGIVGAVCGTSLDSTNLNTTGTSSITNSSIPTSAILSAVNHSMCLSASNNRAESETLKNDTLNNINKQSKKKNINTINIDIQKSSKEIINRLISDDEYVLEIFKTKDIKLNFLSNEQQDVLVKSGRNIHHVSANKLHNRKKQLKFIGEMMIGGIRGPWLHYKKARNLYKDNLPKIEQLSEKQIELENLILKIYPDFFKINSTINKFRY